MSTVYAAVDERLDRLVAVKVMSAALSADPAFTDRFAREARAAARLTHLNVVSVYDQGQERGPDGHHVFLVMELVEGRTLRELLRERGRLSPAEAISIMEPVLSALAAAHRAGLVHRDVKPENILLSDDGVVKVADFGLARAVESDAAATRTGLMMGTVAYCAPEQISKGRADQRSDVYSAGVVLFELLTGGPPYRGDSAMNVAYQHVHSRVPAPSSRIKGVPTEIDELVVAATDSDPESRPADASAFLAEIADLRTTLALPVVPVPPRDRPRGRTSRPEQRYRTPDAATTETIRGASGQHDTAIVGESDRPSPVRREGGGPPPPVVIPPPKVSERLRRRRRALIIVLILLLVGAGAGYAGWWFATGRYSRVPELTGLSLQSAEKHLRDAGYQVREQPGPEFSDSVKRGLVLRTDPDADTRLVRGRTVTIILSAGPKLYQLPQVRGQSFDDARRMLAAIGPIKIADQPKQEYSDSVAANEVTRTDPKVGSRVTDKQVVTIYVSKGKPIVDVPSIAQGTPYDQAADALRQAGLKPKRVDQFSDSVGKGEVISLDPSDRARKDSTITVTVSKGPEIVQVPAIAGGTPVDQAEKAIREAGLVPQVSWFGGGDHKTGSVLAISPPAAQRVKSGSVVTIYALGS
jgi:serine/threonine-protein kinase